MLYRTLLILLLSVMVINPAISADRAPAAVQMDCHGSGSDISRVDINNCDMNHSECCDAELPGCCLQLSAVVFILPTGLQRFASVVVIPEWVPPAYHSAIAPPVYHPPRFVVLSV